MEYTKKRIYFIIPFALFLFLSQVSLPVPLMQVESSPFDLRNDPGYLVEIPGRHTLQLLQPRDRPRRIYPPGCIGKAVRGVYGG